MFCDISATNIVIVLTLRQGFGNMSDLVPFLSGQVENFYLLFLGQVQMFKVNTILYFIF